MVNKKTKNNGSKKGWLILFLVLLIVAIVVGAFTFFPCNKDLKRYDFKITSADGKTEKVSLKLEVADNDETRLKGLMHRKEIPENTGMIFDFETPDYYSMWMKNTYVPLDMIFFNNDSVVIALANDREPLTEDYINPCNLAYELSVSDSDPDDKDWNAFFDGCEEIYLKPEKATRYVIEVPAGTIKKAGIEYGDKLSK
ncbi:DUF192 domain-containing protein [bacterium]|nr:DUF192 domain-containing protein [bacterium]